VNILPTHRAQTFAEDDLGGVGGRAVEQRRWRRLPVTPETARNRVPVERPDLVATNLMPLLLGGRDHLLDVLPSKLTPFTALLSQRREELVQRSPALSVKLKLVDPRLVAKGV
jgi:hypothetical protein